MKISKIIIENFKSIEKIEFDIKKYWTSYTTMLLWVNESGKSNILEAMSFLDTPKSEFDYNSIHSQKDEKNSPVDLWFYLDFERDDTYQDVIKKEVINGWSLSFKIDNVIKNIYLQDWETYFSENIDFEIKNLNKNLFIKQVQKNEVINGQTTTINKYEISEKNDTLGTYKELTDVLFKNYFGDIIIKLIKKFEPKVSFWKPSDKYLISDVDLNVFKDDIDSNIPLKHIFALWGYIWKEKIKWEIEKIANDLIRRKLMSSLSKAVTKYVKEIWKHKIEIDIEIKNELKCVVCIKDEGENNEHNYYKMNARSEWFKQFMSLILSLSIETKKLGNKNKLILIDEPEAHLHPSGIRDLKEELLKIGENNYLFVSTHSPFLVDIKNKERNIIIKKIDNSITKKKEINNYDDIRDDEVLDEAFGINIYKDLLTPNRILVEGASDKIILQKSFDIKNLKYGVTNGTGSNIITLASKLNGDDIVVLVMVDDDRDWQGYKKNILKIWGVYNINNVFTIRDLVGNVINEGTIEDLLGKEFIESKFKEFYLKEFKEVCNLSLTESPFIEQIKKFLHKNDKFTDKILEDFKKKISNDFKPVKTNFDKNFPLLKSLLEKISEKLDNL
ncbi:MAG: hypothetical protein ACD_2C00035G0001 [uncultured bacterium (gcode 4)]|uniref:Endonuclease GajA/Old nuclease/RecF-like AAA domain-containing protein n=1 Tax=uncultured bacterium (gcode 4) TaxID=1234023 RepID=K2G762_9BACT|nr:MAG: hypothetical protein ACD_2C00035G0001 [uncultured bacterium (gcode 4)]